MTSDPFLPIYEIDDWIEWNKFQYGIFYITQHSPAIFLSALGRLHILDKSFRFPIEEWNIGFDGIYSDMKTFQLAKCGVVPEFKVWVNKKNLTSKMFDMRCVKCGDKKHFDVILDESK